MKQTLHHFKVFQQQNRNEDKLMETFLTSSYYRHPFQLRIVSTPRTVHWLVWKNGVCTSIKRLGKFLYEIVTTYFSNYTTNLDANNTEGPVLLD